MYGFDIISYGHGLQCLWTINWSNRYCLGCMNGVACDYKHCMALAMYGKQEGLLG